MLAVTELSKCPGGGGGTPFQEANRDIISFDEF